jgi:hypothetical protein
LRPIAPGADGVFLRGMVWQDSARFGIVWQEMARFSLGGFFLGVFPPGFGWPGPEFVEMAGVCGQTEGVLGLNPRCWLLGCTLTCLESRPEWQTACFSPCWSYSSGWGQGFPRLMDVSD